SFTYINDSHLTLLITIALSASNCSAALPLSAAPAARAALQSSSFICFIFIESDSIPLVISEWRPTLTRWRRLESSWDVNGGLPAGRALRLTSRPRNHI